MAQLAREKTKQIQVGNITLGGQNRVLIQSMCNIKTSNFIKVAEQINECAALGADLMRVSVLDMEDAHAIKEIKKLILIPLIADIHFDYKLALASIEAGADAVRLNPGNIGSEENVRQVVDACKEKHIPIRIGVNSGSIDKEVNNNTAVVTANELVESVSRMVKTLEKFEFYDIVISLKCSHVLETIESYRLASKKFNYPLHIGITEAGPKDVGLVRSVSGLAPLLLEGIGDTIRISLSDDPAEEVRACRRLLKDLGIRNDYPNLISCPTCGRTQVNLVPLANKIMKFLEENKINKTVAVMGCIVNGPGEAKRADIGCAGGKGEWVIFKKDTIIKKVPDKDIYEELTKLIKEL
ncbi:MAG: flavodoxin-dependent (E)-4-hydroxy-3-methylbut-2-enyl-diphosphate synthase [Bacilli bacterium]|nr:flavodoxin-dependent (E)-4-hydroxy-3-methylbut-2-enyl-diphosphate synthase [Bacilli bacterium]MDY6363194.1 flavodoxin-dependent (E)-4-hydroxy-3-methylbut-2-enyl-diphosphate synthase [Bacilli bacterium]